LTKSRALMESESKTKDEISAMIVRRNLMKASRRRSLNLVNRTSLLERFEENLYEVLKVQPNKRRN